MLYSAVTNVWKVGDFGLTAPGTSTKALTTRYAAGTPCYRAPELLQECSEYNNKADIFAIGCILFELVTNGKKAFASDHIIHEYSTTHLPIELPTGHLDSGLKQEVDNIIHATLAITPSKRPSADFLQQYFSRNRAISIGHICRERGDYKISINAYKQAFAEGSMDQEALKGLGDSYQAIGKHTEAIGAYERAINRGFNHPCVFLELGKVFFAKGDYQAAIDRYKKALKDSSTEELFLRLGDTYTAKGCNDKAIQTFTDAVKRFSNRSIMYEKLGKAYAAAGSLDEAIKWYDRGINISSSSLNTSSLVTARADACKARDVVIKKRRKSKKLTKTSSSNRNHRRSRSSDSGLFSNGFDSGSGYDDDPRRRSWLSINTLSKSGLESRLTPDTLAG